MNNDVETPISPPRGQKIQMRFNQEHAGSGLTWRLIVDDVEHLVRSITIRAQVHTETFEKDGVLKGNIVTYGRVTIDEQRNALVKAIPLRKYESTRKHS